MICSFCNKQLNTDIQIAVCPYCGHPLSKTPKPDRLPFGEIMKTIVNAYGPECLEDRKRTIALFADLAPRNIEEKGLLLNAYHYGVIDLLINAYKNHSDIVIAKDRAISILKNKYISDHGAETVVGGIVFSLGLECKVKNSYIDNNIQENHIKSATIVPPQKKPQSPTVNTPPKQNKKHSNIQKNTSVKKSRNPQKLFVTLGIGAVSLLTVFLIFILGILPYINYNKAQEHISAGEYVDAYKLLMKLGDYKDSMAIAENITADDSSIKLKAAVIGDVVVLGEYEQDNNTENGKETIEWIVLENDGGRALLISQQCLDSTRYHNKYENVVWESCYMRQWLNKDFYNLAFSDIDKEYILETEITNNDNKEYEVEAGPDTNDRVFLLSIDEANKYFDSDEERVCIPTAFAEAQGVDCSKNFWGREGAYCWWWLRSPGNVSNEAANVNNEGLIRDGGDRVSGNNLGTRPAIWISVE